MAEYVAINTIKRDGKYVEPGGSFECDVKEGTGLEKIGAARRALQGDTPAKAEKSSKAPAGGGEPTAPEMLEKIVEAIGKLNPDSDFTADDKPKVPALNEILGFEITAAQRDEAFALTKKED